MANEDWENKKLLPVLTEAYHLIVKLEKKKEESKAEIQKLEKAKKKLAA